MEENKVIEINFKNFKKSYSEYFDLFLEEYPIGLKKLKEKAEAPVVNGRSIYNVFGSQELNELAIKCQASLSMLGKTAQSRLNYIGFCKLIPFDNDVDWYNWRLWIEEENIAPETYVSIYFRINSELKRMEYFIQNNGWDDYRTNLNNDYLVSYKKYSYWKPETKNEDHGSSHEIIINNNYPAFSEEKLYSNIEKIEKKTAIWANVATFLARVSGIKI